MGFLDKLKSVMTKKATDTSPTMAVDKTDIAKVTHTGLLLAASSFVTYMLQNVQPDMFGDYAPYATIVIAIATELSLRFFKNNKKE